MAELIVISFDNVQNAEGAYEEIQRLSNDLVVETEGLALVTVNEKGKTHVQTPDRGASVGIGTANGALFGTLLGILFFVPVAGFVLGGALGALFSGLDRAGITHEFRSRVNDAVKNGRPTVVMFATKLTEDKFGEAIAPFHGEVDQTSLTEEQEKELAHDLAGTR